MAEQRLTGKASYFQINGTRIPITSAKPKHNRELADSTDSSNYDAATDMIHKSQLPVTLQTELSIEGKFRKDTTNAQLISQLYSGVAALPVELGLDSGTIYGHGNFDLSDFECDDPIDDTVTYTCSMKSNGVFTPGS